MKLTEAADTQNLALLFKDLRVVLGDDKHIAVASQAGEMSWIFGRRGVFPSNIMFSVPFYGHTWYEPGMSDWLNPGSMPWAFQANLWRQAGPEDAPPPAPHGSKRKLSQSTWRPMKAIGVTFGLLVLSLGTCLTR